MGSTSSKIDGLTTEKGFFSTKQNIKSKYVCSYAQGTRPYMEDRHITLSHLPSCGDIPALTEVALFAVFDGHGGQVASGYCCDSFVEVLQSQEEYRQFVESFLNGSDVRDVLLLLLQNTFLAIDQHLKDNFLEECQKDGTTGVVTFVTAEEVFVANLGDSRALLCNLTSKKVFGFEATEDHKPSNMRERRRIEECGSTVVMDRVDGGLAMSRSLGDFHYKSKERDLFEQPVTCEIDFYRWKISEKGSFLCVASDGLWNLVSSESTVEKVMDFGRRKFQMSEMTEELVGQGLKSKDNITVILVKLSSFANSRLIPFLGKPQSPKRHFDEINKKVNKDVDMSVDIYF